MTGAGAGAGGLGLSAPSPVIRDVTVDGPHGPLPVRVYAPVADHPVRAGLVWAHGGAFMFGDLDMPEADWVARTLAGFGVVVVSVDYRLAPVEADLAARRDVEPRGGVHFPVASEELTAAVVWASAQDLGVPGDRWSLGGTSAGGNLALGAALRLRDEHADHGVALRSLVLLYPLVHRTLPPLRPELAAKVAALPADEQFTPELVDAINRNYVADPADLGHPYAFPGGHPLDGLPPTFVLNSDADALRASGDLLASELAAAGVDVLVVREEGTRHGHLNHPEDLGGQRSLARMAEWLLSPALVGAPHERPA